MTCERAYNCFPGASREMADNLSRQAEEVETLSSIYGEEWTVEEEAHRSYSILITESTQSVRLYIKFPPEYPSAAPPIVEISAPELRKAVKQRIVTDLNTIYLENTGESIVFQWIERAREILQDLLKSPKSAASSELMEGDTEEFQFAASADASAKRKQLVLIQDIQFYHGTTIADRKSIFQGHAVHLEHAEDIQQVLANLYENKKIASATHNIYAYRILDNETNLYIQDSEDDGENQAGGRLLHLLQILGVKNVLVVVSRWYGGIHLGPDRFRHINNAARQVLNDAGFLAQNESTTTKKKR